MMDPEGKKFGRGPRELTGGVDLISHYKLLPQHDFFCKRTLPLPISESHYLYKVAGDREIRKGEGMELDQLFQNPPYMSQRTQMQPFDMYTLAQAFHFRQIAPVDLPPAEKGIPTISGNAEEYKEKERKHKKRKHRDKEKHKEHKNHKKHKHHHKDRSKDKHREEKRDKSGHYDTVAGKSKKYVETRKHDGKEDPVKAQTHVKIKIKRLNVEKMGL